MSLSKYIEKEQTTCFEKHGVFFAFSSEQYEEQKVEGVKYAVLGAGCVCPADNAEAFLKEHSEIIKKGIAQDIKENGKEAIIHRELCNYECYYTGDYIDAMIALKDYGVTEEEVEKVFLEKQHDA